MAEDVTIALSPASSEWPTVHWAVGDDGLSRLTRIEAEVAFLMARPLPGEVTRDAVQGATEAVASALQSSTPDRACGS